MSNPRYPWWSYAKSMAYRYPELCAKQKALRDTTITPAYGGAPGGGSGRTDKTADAALRELPEVNRRELEAVSEALRYVVAQKNGDKRMEVINLYYWRKSHTLYGAALKVGVHEQTAKEWNREFIQKIAENFGLL